jgi:hypothetical protein
MTPPALATISGLPSHRVAETLSASGVIGPLAFDDQPGAHLPASASSICLQGRNKHVDGSAINSVRQSPPKGASASLPPSLLNFDSSAGLSPRSL